MSSAEIPTGASVTSGGKSWGVCSPPWEPCGLQACGSNGTASSAARPPLLELRGPTWRSGRPQDPSSLSARTRTSGVQLCPRGVNGDLSKGRRPQPWTVGVALPTARWPRGRVQAPGLLRTGSVQVRALTRAGPTRFSPSQHSWNSSAGPAPPRNALVLYCVCFSSRQSKPLQTWWHKRAMSICYYPPLAWSGSYGLSQFSLRVSPGCRRSRVGFEPPPGLPQARVWWLMLAVGWALNTGAGPGPPSGRSS